MRYRMSWWPSWPSRLGLALLLLFFSGQPSMPEPLPSSPLKTIEQGINDSLTSLAKVSTLWATRKLSEEQLKMELQAFSQKIIDYELQLKTSREQAEISSAAYAKSSQELKAEIKRLTELLGTLRVDLTLLEEDFNNYKAAKDEEVLTLSLKLKAKNIELGWWKAGGIVSLLLALAATVWALLK